jgi:hypothetical protein
MYKRWNSKRIITYIIACIVAIILFAATGEYIIARVFVIVFLIIDWVFCKKLYGLEDKEDKKEEKESVVDLPKPIQTTDGDDEQGTGFMKVDTENPVIYCQNCGNKVSENAKFCRKCGTSLKSEAPAEPDMPDIRRTSETSQIQTPPADVNNPAPSIPEPAEPEQSGNYGILILLLAIASIGVIAYIVINYFDSFVYQIGDMLGESDSLMLFPVYLSGVSEIGLGGQWVAMIASAVLAIIAKSIDGGDSLSKAGRGFANFALTIAIIFVVLALLAKLLSNNDL